MKIDRNHTILQNPIGRTVEDFPIVSVYIPRPSTYLASVISPCSGIVGRPGISAGTIDIYYEGNIYKASSMNRWVQKIRHAYDRMRTRYPTRARATVPSHDLIEVASYDAQQCIITISDEATAKNWLGHKPYTSDLIYGAP